MELRVAHHSPVPDPVLAQILVKEAYRILERNYQNRFGEIDIIAEKNYIVIVIAPAGVITMLSLFDIKRKEASKR